MTGAFIPNGKFADECLADDEIRGGLADAVEQVIAPRAEQMAQEVGAPWMPRAGHKLIEVQDDGEAVWLVNTDHGAHLYEYGSVNSPVTAPLRRAVLEAGGTVDEDPST